MSITVCFIGITRGAAMNDPLIPIDLSEKTIVVTSASAGIGVATARRLAAAGATVVAVGRSPERTAAIARQLGTEPVVTGFAYLEQVRAAADELLDRYPRIDVLANNAGGIFPHRVETVYGHELTFRADHLAGFVLTQLLLPRLRDTARDADVRVITTSSSGNRFAEVRIDDLEWKRRRYGNGWPALCHQADEHRGHAEWPATLPAAAESRRSASIRSRRSSCSAPTVGPINGNGWQIPVVVVPRISERERLVRVANRV
ncbi:SDR family NAD(P)-dependent oxidoreductase [Nocardia asteroides]